MERIICDSYSKGEKNLFKFNPDSLDTQKFNQKIAAVNNMYGWLYDQGILQKVAFEIRDYSDVTYFAFDAKDLESYRDEMMQSGVQDADLAVAHIFDVDYQPCIYSGTIELSWTMRSYRDFDGTVGRSWECDLIRHLNSSAVLDVEAVKNEKGIKEAVKLMFELSGFEPSDLVKEDLAGLSKDGDGCFEYVTLNDK